MADIPSDPVGKALFGLFVGSGGNPEKIAQLIDSVKELKADIKDLVKVGESINDLNQTMKETNGVLRELKNKL